MLLIQKSQDVPLSTEYHKANNLCAVIYDHLTEVFSEPTYSPLLATSLEFSSVGDESDNSNDSNLHILDYLKKKGYDAVLTEILVKHVTLSILSDLVNFAYESLSCAQKGKMSVAYALLRKPFKDELILLESMLVDSEVFINKFFHNGNPTAYDPSKLDDAERKEIITAAVEMVQPPIFTAESLFEFRYDKSSVSGISGFADHALHIVTNNRHYPTSYQNLNFVFSGSDEVNKYWKHYYIIVPYLLLYTASVVDAIVFKFLASNEALRRKTEKAFKRLAGYSLWLNYSASHPKSQSIEISEQLFELLQFECTNCKHKNNIDIADIELYFFTDIFVCDNCRQSDTLNADEIRTIFG